MKTVNISITSEQINIIDQLIAKYGFANRSEFFRSLLRMITNKPEALASADDIAFNSPETKDIASIINDFKSEKKYSKAFLSDLEKGLKRSSYFK